MNTALASRLAALAASALLVAAPVKAGPDAQMSASLGNIGFQVVDLTPGDNVAAGYTIGDQYVDVYNNVAVRYGNAWQTDHDRQYPQPGAPYNSVSSIGGFTSVMQGDGTFGNISTSISAAAVSPTFARANADSIFQYEAELTLAPGTALIFTASLTQQFVPGDTSWVESADSSLTLWVVQSNDGGVGAHYTPWLSSIAYPNGWDQTNDFAFTFVNSGSTAVTYNFDLRMDTGFTMRTPPLLAVPEPGSYAMFAAGAAVLAGVARRRGRTPAPSQRSSA